MPLPTKDMHWPPASLNTMLTAWEAWSAWYSGDTRALTDAYAGTTKVRPQEGVLRTVGKAVARWFWGEARTDLTKPADRKLHVPVASDLCQASADLLFAEPPVVTHSEGTPEQVVDRLSDLTGPDFHAELVRGAETSAALGGTYLRVTWDETILDRPFITVHDYDGALPVFRWGRLTEVTFWHVVRTNGNIVWRHLEHHETDPDGVGVIQHGLYQGTEDALGFPVPLTDHPATEHLADVVDEDGRISTLTPGLDVVHWPNVTPNRVWRHHQLGRHMGRSDLDGIEPLLDALDEAYTSLMRDIRLGKAMLIVPRTMVENHGPGAGVSFGHDEVYSPVNAAPGSVADSNLQVEQVQFNIRVAEHEQTIALLWNTIIRSAGYSAQTFGEGGDGTAVTATEIAAKERRSALTKSRKARAATVAIRQAVEKMVAIDQAVFHHPAPEDLGVSVTIADGVQDDPRTLAETAALLSTAMAASVETRVRLVNPGRDDDWIASEVARIMEENNLTLADPDTVGLDGANMSHMFTPGEEDTGADPTS